MGHICEWHTKEDRLLSHQESRDIEREQTDNERRLNAATNFRGTMASRESSGGSSPMGSMPPSWGPVTATQGLAGAAKQEFATGANRSPADHKIDYEGHLSPEVLAYFGDYMHRHRINRRTGERRASDNWQLGIPLSNYMKSLVRHLMDLWRAWRGTPTHDPDSPTNDPFTLGDLLCAIIFNAQGMLFELIKTNAADRSRITPQMRQAVEFGMAAPAALSSVLDKEQTFGEAELREPNSKPHNATRGRTMVERENNRGRNW